MADQGGEQAQPQATGYAQIPAGMKDLRCCRTCKLIKTYDQFEEQGCDNCQWDGNDAPDYTTAEFTGMISVIDPSKSWAAKWTHVSRRFPGCYAVQITEDAVEGEDVYE
ncbi:unnamed protein product [Pedinophyceae sp. YPF-701]|nr:unnamed protein product [Pedinophyceae sp. YPF-701]